MKSPKYKLSSNTADSHQINPSWLVYFVKFVEPVSIFNSKANGKTKSSLKDTSTIIVTNDCIGISISNPKASFAKTCNLTMKITNFNYQSELAPGDWVTAWVSNSQSDIDSLSSKLKLNSNFKNDLCNWKSGLKFIGRVLTISTNFSVSPNGVKTVTQSIQCQSFLELANSVYFTYEITVAANGLPAPEGPLAVLGTDSARKLFLQLNNKLDTYFSEISKTKNPDDIVLQLFLFLLGIHRSDFIGSEKIPGSYTDSIFLPPQISKVLNRSEANEVWQSYNFYGGIQKYNSSGTSNPEPWKSFNPVLETTFQDSGGKRTDIAKQKYSVIWRTPERTEGFVKWRMPLWDNVPAWSILNQYSHNLLNEMFTCLRVNPQNCIGPSLIVREQPFSTGLYNFFKNGAVEDGINIDHLNSQTAETSSSENTQQSDNTNETHSTRSTVAGRTMFGNLPRWVIDNSIISSITISQNESRRTNFVMLYPTVSDLLGAPVVPESMLKYNELNRSAIIDDKDITRNGLRADIHQDEFFLALSGEKKEEYYLNRWTKKRADWLFNGHLKLNGTVTLQGIVEPICEGDNAEINGVVYHIENVNHSCSISGNGIRSFITTLQLSNGLLAKGLENEKKPPAYFNNLRKMASDRSLKESLISNIDFTDRHKD